jgi:hypothetical protein
LTDLLGDLPDGRLLALGANPATSIAGDSSRGLAGDQQWLWIWNPSKMLWGSLPTPASLTWPDACDALCWQTQISLSSAPNAGSHSPRYYLYLAGLGMDNEHQPLYRVLI